MADRIEANYEVLDEVAGIFSDRHEIISSMLSNVTNIMESLRSEGWQGRGSDAFYAEMTDEVLPRVRRLADALEQASQTTRQISQTMQSAEEDAGNLFRR